MTVELVIPTVELATVLMSMIVYHALRMTMFCIGLAIDVSKNAEMAKTWDFMSVMMEI